VQAIGGTAGVLEGNFAQLPIQAYGVMATIVWDLVATFVILLVLKLTIGIRVSEAAEIEGLDLALHGETVQ
jgi:Amt family ammonium transporter